MVRVGSRKFFALFFFLIYMTCPSFSDETPPAALGTLLSVDERTAIEALLTTVSENRIYGESLNGDVLTRGILQGIISVLDDRFAAIINIPSIDTALRPESALYVDCGFSLETDAYGRLLVVSVAPNSPAAAVIKPGDLLLQIDSMNTAGLSNWELMPHLMGPVGSRVNMVLQSEGEEPRHVSILRKEHPATAVTASIGRVKFGRWIDDAAGEWAWVKVHAYTDPLTQEQWTACIKKIWQSQNVEAIILDLRDNGGGDNSCITTLGDFFPRGEPLVQFEGLVGEPWGETVYNTSLPCARLIAYPLVVLVNERTASLAEIVAATLQEQRDVQLVGVQTFGKGTTQTWLRLNETYAAHLTLGRWLTPEGNSIHGVGLTPDVVVADNPRTRTIDEQLVEAVRLLKNR
jgi:carboxyl-terminal processing protease